MTSTFPKRQILDWSNLKEVADDNFKFYKNGRKFSKRVENTVGKGEIARYTMHNTIKLTDWTVYHLPHYKGLTEFRIRFVCFGFYTVSTVFQ